MEEKKSILKEEWFAWLMYFLIPLFGIFLFWKNRFYPVFIRILITCLYIIPMSLIITFVTLFFTTDLPDKLSATFSGLEDKLPTNLPTADYDKDAQKYINDLMYYLEDNYGGEDWYYDMTEMWVEINFVSFKEVVTIKVFTTNDQKQGYEDQMYAAILQYCKEIHPITYDNYRVKVYNKDKKVIFEKEEKGKQKVVD